MLLEEKNTGGRSEKGGNPSSSQNELECIFLNMILKTETPVSGWSACGNCHAGEMRDFVGSDRIESSNIRDYAGLRTQIYTMGKKKKKRVPFSGIDKSSYLSAQIGFLIVGAKRKKNSEDAKSITKQVGCNKME